MTNYTCPVCGFDQLKDRARSTSGAGSLEICPSCGFQFGYDDDSEGISDEEWRAGWVERGMPWFSRGRPQPEGWDPKTLLDRLLNAG